MSQHKKAETKHPCCIVQTGIVIIQKESMDPISDVLSLLRPRTYGAGGFDMAAEWAVEFPHHQGIKCYAMVSGRCWLSVQAVLQPVLLKTGDCFLLPRGRPFTLASDLSIAPVHYKSIARIDGIATLNGGGDCFIVGGHFSLEGVHAHILLSELAAIVHLRDESDKAVLRWSLERMREELQSRRPGTQLIVQDLAHMMLIQALRLHLAEGLKGGVGWLLALADKQIGSAISAMHDDAAHRWSLQKLAKVAGMSRSGFALKFKETVGASPMEYLTRWRMQLAGDRLENTTETISSIAVSLGYESESAFSSAFRRVIGISPKQYSRRHDATAMINGGEHPLARSNAP